MIAAQQLGVPQALDTFEESHAIALAPSIALCTGRERLRERLPTGEVPYQRGRRLS